MRRRNFRILAATALVGARPQDFEHRLARGTPPLTVQASALASMVGEIAGYRVSVPHARLLWVEVGNQLHRGLQVGEEHCHLLTLAFDRIFRV